MESPQKRKLGKTLIQIAGVAVFVALIYYFMQRYSADISSVRRLAMPDIAIIGAWSFVSYTAYAHSLFVVFRSLGLEGLGSFAWIRIYFVSRLVNLFVLQGGNLFRLFVLKKQFGFAYSNTVGISLLLLWLNAVIALAICGASVFFLDEGIDRTSLAASIWAVGFAILLSPAVALLLVRGFTPSPAWLDRVMGPVRQAANAFTDSLGSSTLMLQISGLGIVHFLFFIGVNYFSFHALDIDISVAECCLFTTAFVFTRYVNIVPGNLGLSELVGGLVSEILGTGFGSGLVVAGIVRIVEVLMILVIGFVYGNQQAWQFIKGRDQQEGS